MGNGMLTNIVYVTIYVTDQDHALGFYTEGLGLEKQIDYDMFAVPFHEIGQALGKSANATERSSKSFAPPP